MRLMGYNIEIGSDKTKIMTNNPHGFQREITVNGERLGEMKSFGYLESVISNEWSKPDITKTCPCNMQQFLKVEKK